MKTVKVCHDFDLLCEYVAGVNDARDVPHNGTTVGAYLTDFDLRRLMYLVPLFVSKEAQETADELSL